MVIKIIYTQDRDFIFVKYNSFLNCKLNIKNYHKILIENSVENNIHLKDAINIIVLVRLLHTMNISIIIFNFFLKYISQIINSIYLINVKYQLNFKIEFTV